MARLILAINPGSTSTKVALYEGTRELWKESVSHPAERLAAFKGLMDQLDFRASAVRDCMIRLSGSLQGRLSAVVGRGGLLRPLPGGVYEVNARMKADLTACRYGIHASNLGALIADGIAQEYGVKAYIVDPVVVDELSPLARYSGIPEIPRRSIFHALNQKATAKKAARRIKKPYEECLFIVAHIGGGTSVGVHVRGKVVDVNNALDGDGPLSIERAGTVPAGDWMRYVLSRQEHQQNLQLKLTGRGGLVAYLNTNDFAAIERAAAEEETDGVPGGGSGGMDGKRCRELVQTLAYQTSKSIAALSAAVEGHLDAIVLTGGLVFSRMVVEDISRRVSFLAPIMVFPGENELEALALGAREVLDGEAEARIYEG
jgi:butyrate kinase